MPGFQLNYNKLIPLIHTPFNIEFQKLAKLRIIRKKLNWIYRQNLITFH